MGKINLKTINKEVTREGLLIIVMHYMTLVGNSSNTLDITKLLEKMCSELLTSKFMRLWRVDGMALFSQGSIDSKKIVLEQNTGLVYNSFSSIESGVFNLVESNTAYSSKDDNPDQSNFKDMLLFPIQDELDKVIGVVQACTDKNDLQQFTQNDLHVMESISIFIAKVIVSMENGSLDVGNRNEDKFVEKSEKIVEKLQNELKAAEKKVEVRTQFLAEIAHEIRTPMHAMMGFIELLKDEETDERKSMYLENAHKSAQGMAILLNDTLDFTKVDKGEMHLEEKEASLLAEVYSMVSMFYMKMTQSEIRFFSYIDPLIPSALKIDTLRIRQVLSNLLSNAIKFTPKNGTILLEITYDEKKSELLFCVKDSGIGIAPENQEKIFQAYSQEKDSTSREYGGTGLGLSISLQLVELFGSKLELDSTEGEGSSFYFKINIKDKIINETSEFDIKSLKKHIPLLLLDKDDEYIVEEVKKAYLRIGLKKTDITHVSDLKSSDLNEYSHIYASNSLAKGKKLQDFLDQDKVLYIVDENAKISSKLNGKIYNLEGSLFANEVLKIKSSLGTLDEDFIRNKTILTVDDNPINPDLMESILTKMGAQVIKAIDGKKALNIYKDKHDENKMIDLIFMDQNMPGMSGCETASAIKAYEKEHKMDEIAIIGLCGTQTQEVKDAFENAGVLDCLCKPVCIDTIKKTVKKYIKAA